MTVNRPSTTSRKSTRHPAVIDTLGAAPTTTFTPGSPDTQAPGRRGNRSAPERLTSRKPARTMHVRIGRKSTVAAAIAATAVAVVGWGVLQLNESTTTTPAAPPTAALAPTLTEAPEPAESPTSGTDVGDQCRSDRGDQKSGAGVIAAFEHAYYVARSGLAARALAAPDSPLPAAEKIQAGIDTVPVGTNYCLRTIPIAESHYSVVLSEMRPGQPATQFTQTITTKHVDGRWFVDVIT